MAYPKTYWYLKSGGWAAVSAWSSATSYNAGIWVRQLATPTTGNERCFICIVTGVSGGSEPTWAVTRGAKTVDNTATWIECTGVAGPNGDAADTLNWNSVKNTAVSLGVVIKDIAATTYFICVTAGTAGNGAEPTWNTTTGANTTDNTVTWMSMGTIASYATPFLYPFARKQTPAGSGFMLAGETCYVSNNHAETQATAMNIANTNGTAAKPLIFLCVNDAAAPPTALATTATVTTTGNSSLSIGGSVYSYGTAYTCSNGATQASLSIGSTSNGNVILDTCSLILGSTGAGNVTIGASTNVTLLNPSITFGNAGSQIQNGGSAFNNAANLFTVIGGSIAASGTVPTVLFAGTLQVNLGVYTFRDVNLAALAGSSTLVNLGAFNQNGNYYFENCKLGAGVTPTAGGFISPYQGWFRMHNCDSAATNYRYYYQTYGGTVQQSTSIYNNAGATDGTTPISWRIDTTANTTFTTPFVSETITAWGDTTGGSKTITVQLTCATALNNNDIYIEIEYLGTAGFPVGSNASSRMAWFGTPTALTASAATWTGALANVYKIAQAYTPNMKGPVKVRVYVVKPSLTVYVDPFAVIS